MYVFSFNAKHNRESLREFNDRMQEYCLDSGVVSIVPSVVGGTLNLKVSTLDDMRDIPTPEQIAAMPPEQDVSIPTLLVSVRAMTTKDGDWEEQIASFIKQEEDKATEEEPIREVIDVTLMQNYEDPSKGWAIITVVTGDIDLREAVQDEGDEGNDPEGDDENGDDQPTGPTASPAAGFTG